MKQKKCKNCKYYTGDLITSTAFPYKKERCHFEPKELITNSVDWWCRHYQSRRTK